jgi:hypothetical protein
MTANRDRAYKVKAKVRENLNEIDDGWISLTSMLAPVDLVEAEAPLAPRHQSHGQCLTSPATVDHSLSRVAGLCQKGSQVCESLDHSGLFRVRRENTCKTK